MCPVQRVETASQAPRRLDRFVAFLSFAALFVVFTALYETVRYFVGPDSSAAALQHARSLVDFERTFGLFVEPSVQRSAQRVPWLEEFAVWTYKYEHLAGSVIFLAWAWLRRPSAFPFVWRWFWIAHAIALGVFLAFPVAPPRLVPELGLADPTAADLASTPGWAIFERYRNDFAAVPSLHVGYPLLFATTLWFLLPRTPARWIVWCWPAAVLFAVVATANHFWIDGLAGAATVGAALLLTVVLSPALPRPWTAQPDSAFSRRANVDSTGSLPRENP